jgi:hypothetical protein
MIKILNSSLERQAILNNVINPNRFEELNGENTLTFSAILDEKTSTYIDENAVIELDDDYFDIACYKKNQNEDGTLTVDVEAEHISYRLNNSVYDMEGFTSTGTPTTVLTALLNGTGFTVGTVEFSDDVTYATKEKKSRRMMLMEFIAFLGGEVDFEKTTVSILQHRGSEDPKILTKGKNIKVVSKIYNKRELDANGNPLISYTCSPIMLPDTPLALGDEVLLIQKDLGIQEQLRIVRIGYNPYDPVEAEIELANFVSGLEDDIYRIETATVVKDKLYHGCRIGPEFGFECVRSDNKARAYFNSENFVMQSGDGSGSNWTNKLYFDLATGEYIFDGKITISDLGNILAFLYKDIMGGKLEIYDNEENTEVEIGVASEAGDNTGGVILLYNNGKSNLRVAIGVLEDDDGGILQLLDSSERPRIELRGYHNGFSGPIIGIRNTNGELTTYFRENIGYIGGDKIATEDFVESAIQESGDDIANAIASAIAAHESAYHSE